ncbi:MAG: peptidoglycan DD-metalloendopeptidase family protein [Anaerolineae bacterium]
MLPSKGPCLWQGTLLGRVVRLLWAVAILLCSPDASLRALASAPEKLPSDSPPSVIGSRSGEREGILTYTVQPGDTVYGLAKRFGLRAETIIWANEGLAAHPDRLQVGQTLRILPLDGVYYVTQAGDTLSNLARRFGVTVQDIVRCRYNHIPNPDRIRVDMALIIPGAKAAPFVPRQSYFRGRLPADAPRGTGTYVWPLWGVITQRFHKGHPALDIGAPKGTPVRAVDSGFVVESAWEDNGYGNCIVIDHGNGVKTRYAHLSAYHVGAGEPVAQGQVIGEVGATGQATGSHLHLEIIVNGVPQDPLALLPPR